MTENQQAVPIQDQKAQDKELNFRALEAKYKRELEQERQARVEAEKRAQEASTRQNHQDEKKYKKKSCLRY